MSDFKKYVIKHALRKPAPETISPGDPNLDAKAVFIGFTGPNSIDYRILEIEDNAYIAEYLDKAGERRDCAIPLNLSKGMSLTIRYWYRSVEMTYNSALHYSWSMLTREAFRIEFINKLRQFYYNKSLKIRNDRTEVLQAVVDEHLRRRSREGAAVFGEVRIDRLDVVQLLYGYALWGHPHHADIIARLDLIIDSLIDSGDLKADHSKVIVTGKAITSISTRVEEDRRHKDQVAYNKAIQWLTFGLLIAAIAQVLVAYFNNSAFGGDG